jgi:glycosyltransferase involved in cell wall biosynthesis
VPETPLANPKLLTVIVPITQMAGRMSNLNIWFSEAVNLPMNIVIVHDIQDHHTSRELEDLVKNHSQLDIEVIEGTFGSPGLARNAGLTYPLATWTAFWDADDLPAPREALAAIAQTNIQSEVIIGNFTINSPEGTFYRNHKKRLENVALNPGLWRLIIRSTELAGISFSAARMGEDQLYLVDLNLGSRKIFFSDKIFYQYFQGSTMQLTSNQESINHVEKTLNIVRSRFKLDKKLQNRFSEVILMRLLITTIFRTKNSNRICLIIRYTPVIFQLNPRTLARFVISFRQIQAEKK